MVHCFFYHRVGYCHVVSGSQGAGGERRCWSPPSGTRTAATTTTAGGEPEGSLGFAEAQLTIGSLREELQHVRAVAEAQILAHHKDAQLLRLELQQGRQTEEQQCSLLEVQYQQMLTTETLAWAEHIRHHEAEA